MKFLYILALSLLISVQAFSATVFVPWGNDRSTLYGPDNTGQQGAEILSTWELKNPDKKIVSVATFYDTGGDFRGFWITYEPKAVALAKTK